MRIIICGLILFASLAQASEVPQNFTYQGKVYKNNSTDPLTSPSVNFTVQIRTPDGACLLYEETHHRDMTSSDGFFSLIVGEGTNTGATALSIKNVFDNSTDKIGAGSCSYHPLTGDLRRIRLSYNDGNGPVIFNLDQRTRSVPYALHANTLQGRTQDDFLQVNSDVTQSRADFIFSHYSDLSALINGSSNTYVKASDLSISNGVVNVSSGGLKVADTPTANDHAVNKNYTDSKVAGKNVDVSSLANGQILVWNSAQQKWLAAAPTTGTLTSITAGNGLSGGTITTTGTISLPATGTAGTYTKVTTDAYGRVTSATNISSSDITTALGFSPLNKAGDTLSGALNMNGQNILNSGFITMAAGKYIGLGSFTNTTETTLISNTLSAGGSAYAGTTWYNSTTGVVKYWNGVAAVSVASSTGGALTSLNGQTAQTQTLSIGTTGTTPNWSSASGTHTLNIPLASSANVTAGLLSKAEFDSFATKSYSDNRVGGNLISTGVLNNTSDVGKILTWSGNVLGWVADFSNISQLKSSSGLDQIPTNCSAAQTLSYSIMSDTFSCVDISIPAAKITGLGPAASLSVGTATGTVAAGNDTRIVNALQSNASAGGDLGGLWSAPTVQKIQGVAVSTTAPSNGKILKYNSTLSQWEPANDDSNAGTVTSVSAAAPLSVTNGSTTPALSLQSGSATGQTFNWSGSAWQIAYPNMSQMRSSLGAVQMPTNCSASQTLSYSVMTDTFSCIDISIASSKVSGLGGAANLNVGTTAGTVAAGNDSRLTNAIQTSTTGSGDVSGTWLANVVQKIQGVAVSALAPTNGKVLKYNSTSQQWEPADDNSNLGTVTSITAGTGLVAGTITNSGTLNVDVGTTGNKIVQLNNGKLPAVDGSNLTNISGSRGIIVHNTTNLTWTVPAGITRMYVQVWGAGGGGGGGVAAGICGSGGGAGGYVAGYIDVNPGDLIPITIGAGGTAGAAAGNGAAGGQSKFGDFLIANGGAAGQSVGVAPILGGSLGGTLLGLSVSINGGTGDAGVVNKGGQGGSSPNGGSGGSGSGSNTNAGAAGAVPGGGGGGGGSVLLSASSGGAGAAGRIVITY